ncbi:Oxidoreductase andH [Lachnellula suecica]|uniref:Oxidoreductase andH n=1 Tax=Lachnellula suecica TaxID=602035 RepID=A0A8T9CI92_9HELO|nr:Oxidoreductase andH [Lachnellula suecica]
MVSLSEVEASNSLIPAYLSNLVAVFVGATSGIGETSLKQFAKLSIAPRIYFVGRSQEAGDRISAELKDLNAKGEYTFIKADVSLIRVVDDVCRDIMSKEKAINVLFLSQGSLAARNQETAEGLHMLVSLSYYSRNRFIVNLLPLLRQATTIRRVVTVLAGGYEGPIIEDDFQAWKIPISQSRGHQNSMAGLSLEAIAKNAPTVSFIHSFPGFVDTNLMRDTKGPMMFLLWLMARVMVPFMAVPSLEVGERHAFLLTSAKYPARSSGESGVPLANGIEVVRGTNGEIGSGVYSLNQLGESSGSKIEALLAEMRAEGMVEKLWSHTEEEYKRITGVAAV